MASTGVTDLVPKHVVVSFNSLKIYLHITKSVIIFLSWLWIELAPNCSILRRFENLLFCLKFVAFRSPPWCQSLDITWIPCSIWRPKWVWTKLSTKTSYKANLTRIPRPSCNSEINIKSNLSLLRELFCIGTLFKKNILLWSPYQPSFIPTNIFGKYLLNCKCMKWHKV